MIPNHRILLCVALYCVLFITIFHNSRLSDDNQLFPGTMGPHMVAQYEAVKHEYRQKDKPLQVAQQVADAKPLRRISGCDALFNAGFTERTPVCTARDNASACFYNHLLQASICDLRNLTLHRREIHIDKDVRTRAQSVLLRGNPVNARLPFGKGAFGIDCALKDNLLSNTTRYPAKTYHMINSLAEEPNDPQHCKVAIDEPVLLLHRSDNTNLYSSMSDWYNVHQVARSFNLTRGKFHVIFLDGGHSQNPHDAMWSTLFNSAHVNTTPMTACYHRLIIVHPGDASAISIRTISSMRDILLECMDEDYLKPFVTNVLQSFHIKEPPPTQNRFDILILLRHDRQNKKVSRKIANEAAVLAKLSEVLPQSSFNILPRCFDNMTMRDQIQLVRNATIIVGLHGASLTHVLFARRGQTKLVELKDGRHRSQLPYGTLAKLVGVQYHIMRIGGGLQAHRVDGDKLARQIMSYFRLNRRTRRYELVA